MGRHSQNNTAKSTFTYYERTLTGYGTQKQRVGKDSIKEFDSCCLCLNPLDDPRCCTEGHLFCKLCIYESLLQQKNKIERDRKAFDRQQKSLEAANQEQQLIVAEQQLQTFEQKDSGLLPQHQQIYTSREQKSEQNFETGSLTSINGKTVHYLKGKNIAGDEDDVLLEQAQAGKSTSGLSSNFWLPSQTPTATPTLLEQPSGKTFCPEGDEPLRLKQLIPVKFSVSENEMGSEKKNGIYHCPCCMKQLNNALRSICLKRCGHVLCESCLTNVIKDRTCIVCSRKFKRKDMIKLDSGGTGYAGHESGDRLMATKAGLAGTYS